MSIRLCYNSQSSNFTYLSRETTLESKNEKEETRKLIEEAMKNFNKGGIVKEYIFTFGYGHGYDNCFTAIEAIDYEAARKEMFRRYGDKWAFQYDSRESAGVYEYNLKEIK